MKGTIKRLCAVAAALCMAMSLMAVPAFADDSEYIVVFYPGEHGTFADSYVSRLAEDVGEENVRATDAGGVAVMVPSGKELGAVVPQMSDIQLTDERYYVSNVAGGMEDVTAITQDGSAVAQYILLQQGQEGSYVVRYLDQETGEEVAPALRGVANLNSQLTLYPVAVAEYTAVGGAQTVTITAGENEIIFYYTPVVHTTNVTEYLPGGTVVEYDDVAVPGGGAAVVAPGGGTGTGGETIEEGETPLAPGEGEDIGEDETPLAPGDEGEDIDENETPQAGSEGGMNVGAVAGGVVGVAVVVALIVWLVTRKKKSGGAQE